MPARLLTSETALTSETGLFGLRNGIISVSVVRISIFQRFALGIVSDYKVEIKQRK